jgi:thiazole synthase
MLKIGDREFGSRLFVGTGKFSGSDSMLESLIASRSEMATFALKRVQVGDDWDDILTPIVKLGVGLLPNTSGAKNAKDAIFAAQLAREALETNWVKLEIHPDPKYLMPDPVETLTAAEELVKLGFTVLPYCHADPVLCKRLESVGCAAVMPLGAPIGSNQGLVSDSFLKIIIDQATVPVVVDAGIGAPSHAAYAMELGADAVLVNTAIATSAHPSSMADAFRLAVQSGRRAFESGLAARESSANASSPFTRFLEN